MMTILNISRTGMINAVMRTHKAAADIVTNSAPKSTEANTAQLTGGKQLTSNDLAASIVELNASKIAFKASANSFTVAAEMAVDISDKLAGSLFDDKS